MARAPGVDTIRLESEVDGQEVGAEFEREKKARKAMGDILNFHFYVLRHQPNSLPRGSLYDASDLQGQSQGTVPSVMVQLLRQHPTALGPYACDDRSHHSKLILVI